jgi:hypothetical protein
VIIWCVSPISFQSLRKFQWMEREIYSTSRPTSFNRSRLPLSILLAVRSSDDVINREGYAKDCPYHP